MDIPIDPNTEFRRYGHNPTPCQSPREDCPEERHCSWCGATIVEGYRPGFFGERVWTHQAHAASR